MNIYIYIYIIYIYLYVCVCTYMCIHTGLSVHLIFSAQGATFNKQSSLFTHL